MPAFIRTLPVLVLLSLGSALWAQDAEAPSTDAPEAETAAEPEASETAETETPESDPAQELDMGQEVAEDPSYIRDEYGDWQLQCFRTDAGEDPCQMYQLLREEGGNPVAEFSLFKLPGNSQAVAGATIAVPLGTLLPEGLKIAVDSGPAKGYNFSFCSMAGCFARIGFTAADVAAFKAGAEATLVIVPAQAPDQTVAIKASLNGFTAAYNEASVIEN
ncbi:invasion associated locus B family protein [Roseovarius aestuariivivens]|uniref:invasion associated locus B family protein n=1 Tax=Roseovarius aestuariivivens TaxID=1888910 RepID=UPI00108077CF|nr:invasion associated locus B family protein [Roseovarius aestuariivivens]